MRKYNFFLNNWLFRLSVFQYYRFSFNYYNCSIVPEHYNIPNEADLKVEVLRNLYTNLYDKNSAVIEAQVQMNKARSQRFNVLYKPLTGMIDLALDAKLYIKSVAGAGSVPFKQISGLAFRSLAG